MYYYLALPVLLPRCAKVLKIDADMLVLGDVGELWETDLGDHPMAAARELGSPCVSHVMALPNYKEIGIPPETPYCNAGLQLINLDVWRREEIAKRIIEHTKKYKSIIRYWDQDGVNAVLAGRWLALPAIWNVEIEGLLLNGWIPEKPVEMQEIVRRAKLVHFVIFKPWKKNCSHPQTSLFLRYLRKTAWWRLAYLRQSQRFIRLLLGASRPAKNKGS